MNISQDSFCTLLTLPRLEILDVFLTDFHSSDLPEISNLTELAIKIDYAKMNITNFIKALEKMPKLKVLEIETNEKDSDYLESCILQLICEVTFVAVSQAKDILVTKELVMGENREN